MQNNYASKTVQLDSYYAARDALKSDALNQALYDDSGIMDNVLVTLDGEAHCRNRAVVQQVLNADFFRRYEHQRFRVLLHQAIAHFTGQGSVDLIDLVRSVMLHVSADLAGIDVPKGPFHTLPQLANLVSVFVTDAAAIHSLRDHSEVETEASLALKVFERCYVQPSIARRESLLLEQQSLKNHSRKPALPRDILTHLLVNRDVLNISQQSLVKNMAFYLIAGVTTTTNSAVFAIDHLLTWCAEDAARKRQIDQDDTLLIRCIQESLRLNPVSPVAWRRVAKSVRVADTHRLGEGDYIIIDLIRANRDKSVFGEDADSYNPLRQLPKSVPLFGLTFSAGKHQCPARDFVSGDNVVSGNNVDSPPEAQGILAMLLSELLARGLKPDPENPPRLASDTERNRWESYPVLLRQKK